MAFFLENGWCCISGKNLQFISLTKLREKYNITLKATIKLTPNTNTQTTLNNLRYELFKQKSNQFNFLKNIARDLNNPSGNNALIKHKKALRFKKLNSKHNLTTLSETAQLTIALSSLGNIINLSPSSAFNIIKAKVKDSLATVFKKYPKCLGKGFYPNPPKHIFNSNGYIFTTQCNQYLFL